MLQQDFSQIILTKDEKRIFEKFKYSDKIVLNRDEWNILVHTNLIKHHLDGQSDWFDTIPEQGICELSEKGIRYRQYLKRQAKLNRKENRHFWIPIIISIVSAIISNTIAILALIISFKK